MKTTVLTLLAIATTALPALAEPKAVAVVKKTVREIHVVVFDFECAGGNHGKKLSDSIRQRLARHELFSVVDHLTTRDHAGATPANADRKKIVSLMKNKLLVTIAIYGTVSVSGKKVTAEVVCINFANPDNNKNKNP
ncbi:MAG: hypothetical protein GY794_09625, partial [bacterium]|nr:hypothetical protein [bacterium]